MKDTTEILVETVILSVLNIAAVYLAAFVYALNWSGVLLVMILASLVSAVATHYVIGRALLRIQPVGQRVREGTAVLVIALLSSLAILALLIQRFNLPMALGISVLSGLLSSLLRFLLS